MANKYRSKPTLIEVPRPTMGSKGFLIEDWGVYVLEAGPGVLRGIACTHAGAGTLEIIDGVPDEDGFYPDEEVLAAGFLHPEYHKANGRPIFKSPGSVMGMWHLNLGLHHGLTVCTSGGHDSSRPVLTVIWEPFRMIKAG